VRNPRVEHLINPFLTVIRIRLIKSSLRSMPGRNGCRVAGVGDVSRKTTSTDLKPSNCSRMSRKTSISSQEIALRSRLSVTTISNTRRVSLELTCGMVAVTQAKDGMMECNLMLCGYAAKSSSFPKMSVCRQLYIPMCGGISRKNDQHHGVTEGGERGRAPDPRVEHALNFSVVITFWYLVAIELRCCCCWSV